MNTPSVALRRFHVSSAVLAAGVICFLISVGAGLMFDRGGTDRMDAISSVTLFLAPVLCVVAIIAAIATMAKPSRSKRQIMIEVAIAVAVLGIWSWFVRF